MATAILWFRRDLRMNDNPALVAAAEQGSVLPVFCLEAGITAGRHASPNRNAYLLAALNELDLNLQRAGVRLHYRHGDPAEELPALAAACGATTVHVNRDYTAHAVARDLRVARCLSQAGAALVEHEGVACAGIAAIATKSGGPYRVFTPFFKSWARAGRRPLAKRPRKLDPPPGSPLRVGAPPGARALGVNADARQIADNWGAGEMVARRAMLDAVRNAPEYHRIRDLPAVDRTTKLSPHLHFGTISARELEAMLLDARSRGAAELRRQLAWRDFWLNVVSHFPANRSLEYDERLRGMRWRSSAEDLEAWKQGNTGVPWIDAGMRQLLAQGWMHNRVRMAVASYLTKNLLLDWREGEAHFMRHLLDGDEAQNNGNWQWAASTGADPQPYFRIFNPVRQQRRFDPDGSYVRRWVPEISGFEDSSLAAPWEASDRDQAAADCEIGADYPAPLVDLGDSRQEAIARFNAQRQS